MRFYKIFYIFLHGREFSLYSCGGVLLLLKFVKIFLQLLCCQIGLHNELGNCYIAILLELLGTIEQFNN